jgi:hypothetical protein
MPEQIAYLLKHRTSGDPVDLGAVTEFLYIGIPAWSVGEKCLSGSPERIAESLHEFGGMGVNHLQVRFRSRELQELLDQMKAFGDQVAPLLND